MNALRGVCEPLGIRCEEVPVKSGLHLKSACTVVDAETLVVLPSVLDTAFFEGLGMRVIEVSEPFGANVLPMGETILVSSLAPITEARLKAEGYETVTVDVSELHKADGALTCLSLRWASSDAWCP
jgi:dimethylargininase